MNRIKEILSSSIDAHQEDRLLTELLNKKFDTELRTDFKNTLHEKYGIKDRQVNKEPLIRKLILFTAVAASLLIGLVFINPFSSSLNSESIAYGLLEKEQFFHPGITKGVSSDQLLDEAIAAFNTQQFQEAVDIFKNIGILSQENTYYLGISLLKTNQYSLAIEQLSRLENTNFSQEAHFYLGIAYALNNDLPKAKETLLSIQQDQYKYQEAQSLLNSLYE